MAWGSVNVPGGSVQGADGKSAYQIAVDNGFSGTEAQWLASLKGAKGDTGATGATGETGPAGPGLPAGGTTGQVAVKKSETDYDTEWTSTLNMDSIFIDDEIHFGKLYPTSTANNSLLSIGGLIVGTNKNAMPPVSSNYSKSMYNILSTPETFNGTHSFGTYFSNIVFPAITKEYITNVDYGTKTITVIKNYSWMVTGATIYLLYNNHHSNDSTTNADPSSPSVVAVTITEVCDDTSFKVDKLSSIDIICGIGTATYMNKSGFTLGEKCSVHSGGGISIGYEAVAYGTDGAYASTLSIGYRTYAAANKQIAIGRANKISTDENDVLIVGGGDRTRANCFRITTTGSFGIGAHNTTGADYAEQFEWADNNPNNEDRVGHFVSLNRTKIQFAESVNDFILGIVSGNPSIIGDSYDDQWQGMYETDIYGRFLWEDVTVPAEYDEEGNLTFEEHVETQLKLNPNYNSSEKYIPRSERKEWATVGMMGKLVLIDDGTCEVNGWAKPSENGIGTKSETQTKFRVMERLDDTHVRVLIL